MALPIIKAALEAIKEGSKAYHAWLTGRDKSRSDACKEAGEKYIFTDEDVTLTDARRDKLKKHYKRRFFHYN